THAEGYKSKAYGYGSHAGGAYGFAANNHSMARGAGAPSYGDAAQEVRQPMNAYTSDGTQADMSPGLRVGSNAGSVAGFKGQVAAISKSGYAAHWEVSGLSHNFDGNGAVLASYTVNKLSYTGGAGNLGDTMALTLAAYNDDVVARVTGAAGEYVQWAGYLAAANVYGAA
ncbi:MAG TPA: hypothetical protein VKA64_07975, partial [Gammaproteobacteria bacterium]|nr:hypothetical protein [Gammaproteobacteria bacterium]